MISSTPVMDGWNLGERTYVHLAQRGARLDEDKTGLNSEQNPARCYKRLSSVARPLMLPIPPLLFSQSHVIRSPSCTVSNACNGLWL